MIFWVLTISLMREWDSQLFARKRFYKLIKLILIKGENKAILYCKGDL